MFLTYKLHQLNTDKLHLSYIDSRLISYINSRLNYKPIHLFHYEASHEINPRRAQNPLAHFVNGQ